MDNLQKVKVKLFTSNCRIEGYLVMEEGLRLSNYLNKDSVHFIILTKVSVYDWSDKLLMSSDFLCVNKDSVIFARDEEK